jgi:hypothetical protein
MIALTIIITVLLTCILCAMSKSARPLLLIIPLLILVALIALIANGYV